MNFHWRSGCSNDGLKLLNTNFPSMQSKRLDTGFVGAQTAHNLLTSSLLAIQWRLFGSQSRVFTRIESLYATRIQQDLRAQNMEGSEKFKRQQRNPQGQQYPYAAASSTEATSWGLCMSFFEVPLDDHGFGDAAAM